MSPLAALVRRLRGLFGRGREDAETQDELRFHLEMETEKNLRAGMDPGEARRRAHVRLGGADAIREAVRDARGWRRLEDLARDVGYALRGLRRNPGFTLAAVVSLAVPICFNTAVFTIVDSVCSARCRSFVQRSSSTSTRVTPNSVSMRRTRIRTTSICARSKTFSRTWPRTPRCARWCGWTKTSTS